MRKILGCCLLFVAGCGSAELTREGMQVRSISEAPSGCQIVGTLRDAEGGGLRSFETNRAIVESRLRNEAARIGGNALSVITEERGDTEEGKLRFTTGVPGLTTPAAHCSNCVEITARVFSCGAGALPAAAAPDPQQHPDCDWKPAAQQPAVPAAPPVPVAPVVPAAPVVAPPPYVAPRVAPTVIIILPPPPMAPPPQVVPQAPPQDDYHR